MRFLTPALAAMLAVGTVMSPVMIQPAHAQTSAQGAGQFIDVLANQAFAVLKDKSLSRDAARTKFRGLLQANFATKQIGDRLIRTVRNQITPQQYSAYSAAFPNYVVNAYADRLYEYSNADLKVVNSRATAGGYTVQTQVIQPGEQPMTAVWTVRPAGDKYQITNLTVAGINLAITQEADFKSVIQRKGFDALVQFMKSRG
jgi:phospholipid transport system substrate-binding protein